MRVDGEGAETKREERGRCYGQKHLLNVTVNVEQQYNQKYDKVSMNLMTCYVIQFRI